MSSAPKIPWKNIDTVLLDMDGTLLDLHYDNYFWLTWLPLRYAETHKVPLREAEALLGEHIRRHEGTLNWYCLDFWSETLSLDVPALKREVSDRVKIRPFVNEFLQRLRQLGKRLILVTNAHPDSVSMKLELTEIDRWLHMVVSSHQFQEPKEAEAFWTSLQALEDFDPARSLFIDDTERILDSAKRFGIAHLLCIRQPDSQRAERQQLQHPSILHFDEIMP